MSTLPLAEVKAKLSAVVDSVEKTHERVTITRNGKPAAVLMSVDEIEGLEMTLEIMSDPEFVAGIREGEAQLARGEYIEGEELTAFLEKYRRP